jgi:hypothetical protein
MHIFSELNQVVHTEPLSVKDLTYQLEHYSTNNPAQNEVG